MSGTEGFRISDGDRFASQRLIRWWDQARLEESCFLVAGCGALGNEAAKNLALLGAGRIVLVDSDSVEESNLSRSVLFRPGDRGRAKVDAAAERMREIRPGIDVLPVHGDVALDLGLGFFRDADAVLSCLDNREARLFVNSACFRTGTPLIDGGMEEISGTVRTYLPPDGACYECGFADEDYRLLGAKYSCGGLPTEGIQSGRIPTTATIASIIGGLQVQEAVKIIHGLGPRSSRAIVYGGSADFLYATELCVREGCLGHETIEDLRETGLSASEATAAGLIALAGGPREKTSVILDRDFVESLECGLCGEVRMVRKPRKRIPASESACRCGGEASPAIVPSIDSESPLARLPLSELGVPPRDIVHVLADGKSVHFLLDGSD